MRNENQHPGRSVDFLSRLHDGELSPGERARFESHRAHCTECRRSAMEFEESLSLFRSARSRPPNADLAARILRKVRSAPRRPPPFGVLFGIDPRWAAAAATVVFGLLLGYAALEQGRESPRIPVSFVTPSAPDSSRNAPTAVPLQVRESEPPARAERPSTRVARKSPLSPADPAPPDVGEADRKAASADTIEAEAVPSIAVSGEAPLVDSRSVEGSGGDENVAARAPLPVVRKAPRMVIEAIDGFGAPPPLLSEARIEVGAGGRERRYILLVDSQGMVREVSPEPRKDETIHVPEASASGARLARPDSGAAASITRLRFKPGNRPRRLLLRFE